MQGNKPSPIGAAVKGIRERLGKTQREFAVMLGCRANTISRWERGSMKPAGLALIELIDLAEGQEKERLARDLAGEMSRDPEFSRSTEQFLIEAARSGQKLSAYLNDRLAEAAAESALRQEPHWHAMLDQILNSGQPDAVNMIQYALLIAEDRVRLKAEKERKRKR
jgi:transcriptional regulator with XRE-family HTH domain